MRSRPAAALAATLALAAPAAAHAADADTTPTLAIQGTGVSFVTPDVAEVTLGIRSGSATRQVARSRANRRTLAVVGALTRRGVPRTAITTAGLTLSRTQVRRGKVFYSAANSISVRFTDVSRLGPALDAATAAGADAIDGPEFSFSDPSAGRAQATRAAIADARRRADDAAAAAGQKVTGVRAIVVDEADDTFAYDSGGTAAASAPARKGVPTSVSAGRRAVTATVAITYTIAPA